MTNPVISLQNLNNELSATVAKFDLLSVVNSAQTAVTDFATAVETKLGTQINQVVGGFQALTQELDDVVPIVNGQIQLSSNLSAFGLNVGGLSVSLNVPAIDLGQSLAGFGAAASQVTGALENAAGVANKGIALLTENPVGLEIKNQVSNLNSDLQALTEDVVEGGFLVFAVTAAIPEAIANTLQKITNEPIEKITNALKEIAPGINGAIENINKVIGGVLKGFSIVQDFIGSVTGFINNTITALTQGLTGFINNVIESAVAPFQTVIDGVIADVEKVLPVDINFEIKANIEAGLTGKAAELLQPYTTLNINDIESKLLAIPTSLSGMLSNNAIKINISTPINIIGGNR